MGLSSISPAVPSMQFGQLIFEAYHIGFRPQGSLWLWRMSQVASVEARVPKFAKLH